jgi:hypothetical protein
MKMETSQAKDFRRGIGRARVILSSELGAITGSPILSPKGLEVDCVRWLTVPQGPRHQFREIVIDAEKLRRMELSLNQLAKYYRPHLTKLVPKPDDWLKRIAFVLDLIKGHVHQPATSRLFPDSPKRFERFLQTFPLPGRCKQGTIELAKKHPRLIPFLAAVAFTDLTTLEEVDFRKLFWIERFANRLAVIADGTDSLKIQLALCQMHDDLDPTWLNFIFDVLTDPILTTAKNRHPFFRARQILNQLLQTFQEAAVDGPSQDDGAMIADQVRAHVLWLSEEPHATVANISQMLGALVGTDLAVHFISQTHAAKKDERLFDRALKRVLHLGVRDTVKEFGTSVTQWSQQRQSPLTELPSGICDLLRLIPQLQEKFNHERIRRIGRFFEQLSSVPAYRRIGMLDFWMKRESYCGQFNCSFDQLLPMFSRLFERRSIHQQLRLHWEQATQSKQGSTYEVVSNQVESDNSCKVMHGVVQLIERLIYDSGLNLPNSVFRELPLVVSAAPTLALAERFVRQRLDRNDSSPVSTGHLALAFWLSPSGADVRHCLATLNNDPDLANAVRAIQIGLVNPNICEVVRKCACGEQRHLVIRLGASADLLAATHATVASQESLQMDTRWIGYYPIALQAALHKLATICPNAERAAASTLADECRPANEVERELGAIKRICADPKLPSGKQARLRKRIANLETRLRTGQILSPAKQAKLLSKLENRYDLELVDNFCRRAMHAGSMKLAEFGFSQLPERFLQSPYSLIIPAVARQTLANRQIAFKALAKSSHDSLVLASEPANERYLNSLRNFGIDLRPWLSEQIVLHGRREDGTSYRVQFTRDPFDIFLMGFYFDTCLSPESFNFFSTIANLVDANKRVLYGRTAAGQVVGRCLFALTTHGKIQTFHRYCRSKEDGFAELVDLFAEKLASAMNTTLTQFGRVPCLVSREWYNDGCLPIKTDSPEALDHLNEALKSCSDSQAYRRALTILGDRNRVIESIESIVSETLPQRPSVAPSLFRELGNEPLVPALVRLRLAADAFQAGAKLEALTIFERIQPAVLLKSLGRTKLEELMQEKSIVDLLLAHDPALTRRMLQRSRPSHIRSDCQEFHPVRREALASIYHKLNRPTSARMLSRA